MLVCSSVEDIFRPVSGEDFFHVPFVGDAGDYSFVLDALELPCHHHPDVVHRGLGLVDEYHFGRLELCYLAHYLGADGAGGSGNHDALPAELSADSFHIDFYLFPREQVVDFHFMQLLVSERTLAVPFLAVGHHHYPDVFGDKLVYHLVVGAEKLGLERGDKQYLHTLVLEFFCYSLAVEIYRLAHDVCAFHDRVI